MKPLDTVARWIAVAVLLLGVAGITVTFVLHLPWPLTVVILMGLLLMVVLEGAYRIWYRTDQERLSAEAGRDAAQRELEAQRQTHERELAEAAVPLSPPIDPALWKTGCVHGSGVWGWCSVLTGSSWLGVSA